MFKREFFLSIFFILFSGYVGSGCATPRKSFNSSESEKTQSQTAPSSAVRVEDLDPPQAKGRSQQGGPKGTLSAVDDAHEALQEEMSNSTADTLAEVINNSDLEPPKKETSESRLDPIPFEMNDHVQKWIQYFTQRDHDRFQRFLNQGIQYREIVESLLEENGLPPQLYYLAMIESGYSTKATSIARAAGVWQFMPATGKRYGLEVNLFTDERRDPIRATEAAAKYLKDLYNVFGSWYLAISAYNAGEFRIMGCVIRGKSRDFWHLVQRKVLPSETSDYIPKFLAAVTIGEDPTAYGFEEPNAPKYPNLEAVEVPSPVRLQDLAQLVEMSVADLQKINPNLQKDFTPPYAKNYEIWLPEEKARNFELVKPQIAQLKIAKLPRYATVIPVSEERRHYHVVKTGETVKTIARRYKLSPQYLRQINRLASYRVPVGTKLRVTAKSFRPQKVTRYTVKRGDNLNLIAKRFGLSVKKLRVMNSIRGNRVVVGQALRIRTEGT